MDKITLIDFHNMLWRCSIGFGPPIKHIICTEEMCTDNGKYDVKHKRDDVHCICGAKWDVDDQKCYGEKYIFIFNFFRNLRPLIEITEPHKIMIVGEGRPQFRYDLYPEYKANRIVKLGVKQESKDRFDLAKDEIMRLLQYLPITIAHAAAYEADDTIGTLCENMKDEDIVVISADSDFIQLLQRGYKNITIYNPIKKETMEAPQYNYLVWKILNGDKSDGIKGILKPKKALATVNDPELFRQLMSGEEFRSLFSINKKLIEFHIVPEEEIIIREGVRNFDALKKEFERMDFQSIINDKSWEKYVKTFDYVRY